MEFGLNFEALIWTESGVKCAKRLKSCCDSVTTPIIALGGQSTYSNLKSNTKWNTLPCDDDDDDDDNGSKRTKNPV